MEHNCPICQSVCQPLITDGRDFFVLEGNSPSFDVVYCMVCQIAFTRPHLTDTELAPYYPDHFEAFVKKKSFTAFLQTAKYKSDIKMISKRLKNKNASLYEIGAGRGEFLSIAANAGFDVAGIEPGVKGIEAAKQYYGITLEQGFATDIKYSRKFDIVVMRHVLEHINDFKDVLKNIAHSGLNTGGVLFIKVPRFDSWERRIFKQFWHGLDLPRHRNHFTRQGIIRLLSNYGFHDISVYNEVVPYDILRSLEYFSKHGKPGIAKFICRWILRLPGFLLTLKCQAAGLLFITAGAGRMIVIAKK